MSSDELNSCTQSPPDATALGPASLSNLGPGFDTIGLCLAGMDDVVDVWCTSTLGVHLIRGSGPDVPMDQAQNTAACAAAVVLKQANADGGLVMRIKKGIPIGSGIGGSAASAAAGAWAANLALGSPFRKSDLVEAVLEGEAVASGGIRHGDNGLPALFGGLVLTSAVAPSDFRRVTLIRRLPLALLLPKIEILTSEARDILPTTVPFRAAVTNASDLALMVHALIVGDWHCVGRYMMRDRLVEPVRAQLLPCYAEVRRAAVEAGAFGSALTGSGPAMFALAETDERARYILRRMVKAAKNNGIECDGIATNASMAGVRSASVAG